METTTAERLQEQPTQEERALAETAEANAHRHVREPLVYQFDGRSYLSDLALAEPRYGGNTAARERLAQHGRQMDAMPKYETRSLEGAEFEYRVNPSLKIGYGGEFAPPWWVNEMFATARRSSPVLQRLIPTFDLPRGVSSVNLPRVITGSTVSTQVPNSPVDSLGFTTEAASSPAVIFAGISDWPIESLEQSPIGAHLDWVVFKDMFESSDFDVEKAFINGLGPKYEEWYGLIELSGTNEVVYTSGSPTGTAMVPKIGEILAQVGVKRRKPPEALVVNTSRFFWLATSEDNSNRPLSIEDYPDSDFPNAGFASVGVYLDDAIQPVYGATKEQDAIFALRPKDMVLFDSAPVTMIESDVLSGTLEVRFALRRTVAAILGRYPSGVSKLVGTGMTPVEGFK
jgi:hypothetical protein